ncbi:aldo/keto reductase [Chitinimonas lacunae]|uniref:Aldo/keto reductase family oxidoreductase n=1 Tax=Chitinimonas lacunae TaxID=1963018 RepID=A0ABV8MU49_9NEIS
MSSTPVPRLTLSRDGPEFSRLVAGTWRLGEWQWPLARRIAWIEACLELGITTFDHADIYGGYTVEALFGEALKARPDLRERIELVSKCGIRLVHPNRPEHRIKSYDTSRAHLEASVHASLKALGTERLDLLLIHRPDPLMDADEIASAFESLQRAGKVRHFGVSNFTPSQFALLDSRYRLVTNQIECSLLHLAPMLDGTLDQAQQLGRAPMIWSPLAGGRLLRGEDDSARQVQTTLTSLAAKYAVSASTLAHAWLLRHPARPLPIVGSSRLEGYQEAAAAFSVELERSDWYALWSASTGAPVP